MFLCGDPIVGRRVALLPVRETATTACQAPVKFAVPWKIGPKGLRPLLTNSGPPPRWFYIYPALPVWRECSH